MRSRRRLFSEGLGVLLLASGLGHAAGSPRGGTSRRLPSSYQGAVTIYGADWCGPCKRLQQALRDQQIPFDYIDIDQNPAAHDRARQATGTSAIPVTSVDRGNNDVVWIIGANADAVARAYRGQ
ncbi:MAG: glutaredoxin family protein [Polyangiaceae bacterium]|jgi:glutaredoxin|nr:glutaredoxin family protein [Polyangiaceae bacterium]